VGGNGQFGVKPYAESRQQTDAETKTDLLLIRDLVKELRLLLSLSKPGLQKKDKEDKENLKEIDRQFKAIDDLTQEMEAALSDTGAGAGTEVAATGAVNVTNVLTAISVFA
jgi:hypothetical protein